MQPCSRWQVGIIIFEGCSKCSKIHVFLFSFYRTFYWKPE
jgi:hypothetical protein